MSRDFLRSDRVRVLVNGIHAKSGGGVTYLRNILPHMAEAEELELHLMLHKDQFDLFYPLPEGVRLHLINFSPRFVPMLLWEQVAIPILARVMSADVTFSPANYGPLLAPRQVIVLRNSLAVVGKERRFIKRVYWLALTLMTVVSLLTSKKAIAVSNYARKALGFGLLRGRISVIYHGVKEIFRPGRKRGKGNFLLVVADIYVQKNLHTVLHALAALRDSHPDLTLKIAGRPVDQDYFDEMQRLVANLALTEMVQFLGAMEPEDLVDLYRTCAVFVFPSTVETFGNPLVEAMACGAPIAASNTAAMPEIIGDAAVFFDPLDADDMARQITRIIDDKNLAEDLRAKSLKRAKFYSWKKTAQETAQVLLEAAGRA